MVVMLLLLANLFLSPIVLGADEGTVKGVVLDISGAVVQNANILILDENGNTAAKATSDKYGKFEADVPAGKLTVIVAEKGFERFKKELNVAQGSVTEIEVKLNVGCSGDIPQLLPNKPDLRHFLVEIHYWGSFGDCPERRYRLWGTGEASISYEDCGGKTYRASRLVNSSEVATTLAKVAKENPGPVCINYPGRIDAATAELTIFSGSEPSLVISHDAGDDIKNVTPVEQELQKLIDPENRMQSFREQAIREWAKRNPNQK